MIREPDFELRVGKITSSNLYRLWGKKTSRLTYAKELRDELEHPEKHIYKHNLPVDHLPASLRWGVINEPRARAEYAFRHQCDIEVPRFKLSPDRDYLGSSIDGIRNITRGLEVKCCWLESEHLKTLRDGIPRKHNVQIFGELHCYELEVVDFVAYDPRRNHPEDYKEWEVKRSAPLEMVLLSEVDRFWDFVIGRGRDSANAPTQAPRFF